MKYILAGFDPGIIDTGLVIIELSPVAKTYKVYYHVWTSVSYLEGESFHIDDDFLASVQARIEQILPKQLPRNVTTKVAVEGYRNRGKNMRQDQQMTAMVQAIHRAARTSRIVDNTGVKKVVKAAFLKLFGFKFPRTNHADLESAARIALKQGFSDREVNTVLASFCRDALDGKPWEKL